VDQVCNVVGDTDVGWAPIFGFGGCCGDGNPGFLIVGPFGGGGGRGNTANNPKPKPQPANKPKSVLSCASDFANKYSIAGGLKALGIGTSGVGGFVNDALGGNSVAGVIDLGRSLVAGEAGGHSPFYNMGQGLAAGPALGIPVPDSLKETPFGRSPSGIATEVIAASGYNAVTGAGETIQTLNGVARLSSATLTGAEFASGAVLVKFGYDAFSYVAGVAVCAAK